MFITTYQADDRMPHTRSAFVMVVCLSDETDASEVFMVVGLMHGELSSGNAGMK